MPVSERETGAILEGISSPALVEHKGSSFKVPEKRMSVHAQAHTPPRRWSCLA